MVSVEETPYTPEEMRSTISRAESDIELMRRGAKYVSSDRQAGDRLDVTDVQLDRARREMIDDEAIKQGYPASSRRERVLLARQSKGEALSDTEIAFLAKSKELNQRLSELHRVSRTERVLSEGQKAEMLQLEDEYEALVSSYDTKK